MLSRRLCAHVCMYVHVVVPLLNPIMIRKTCFDELENRNVARSRFDNVFVTDHIITLIDFHVKRICVVCVCIWKIICNDKLVGVECQYMDKNHSDLVNEIEQYMIGTD
jgi:hypothetical protein